MRANRTSGSMRRGEKRVMVHSANGHRTRKGGNSGAPPDLYTTALALHSTSLAIPARRHNSCSALCTRVSLSVSRVVVFNDDMSDQLAVNQSVFSSSSLRSTVASS